MITAGPEANDISFGGNSFLQQYITDSAGITAGPGCAQIDPTEVQCPAGVGNYAQLQASLGDGNDRFAAGLVGVGCTVNAGGGNDTVYGCGGSDVITGGDGNDDMIGNPGNDTVDGGPGDDNVRGGSDSDHVIGGPGRDTVHGDGPEILDDGNDTIDIADGELDQAQCGFGADIVNADAVDVVEGLSCEVVNRRSRASAKCIVPKLKRKTLKRARKALAKAHCKLGKVSKRKARRSWRGKVISQRPRAGARLPAGSKVRITIGRR